MNIIKIAIGNDKEAYIETRFSKGINIISSDDNNKGKTIVIQSIMYALGNDPIFPSSFNYKDFYHIVEIEINNETAAICRKGSSFTVLFKGNIAIFDNLSEFKHFINKTLFALPIIVKDGLKKLVDPMLFYQMFFVGQDNKDTANIILHGYYNKDDFSNMLYSYYGIDLVLPSDLDKDTIKERLKVLSAQKTELQKQNTILKSTLASIKIASKANDRLKFEEKLSKVNKLKDIISALSNKRNKVTSRMIKNEITLKELRSLNQSLTVGKLRCLDCESPNVGYATADSSYTFDISSNEIRQQIISSIEDKIEAYAEEITNTSADINKYQDELQLLLSEDEVSLESLLLYKSDLVKAGEADAKLIEIDNELKRLNSMLIITGSSSKDIEAQKRSLHKKIIENMNVFYKAIDPQGNLEFTDLFSKKQSVYSGSEETEFYLSKLYALLLVFKHQFPIIMDHFRAGELSSVKEDKVLELFGKLGNQLILTVTLKEQETGKYDKKKNINHVDFTTNEPCKLLTTQHLDKFLSVMKSFSLNIG